MRPSTGVVSCSSQERRRINFIAARLKKYQKLPRTRRRVVAAADADATNGAGKQSGKVNRIFNRQFRVRAGTIIPETRRSLCASRFVINTFQRRDPRKRGNHKVYPTACRQLASLSRPSLVPEPPISSSFTGCPIKKDPRLPPRICIRGQNYLAFLSINILPGRRVYPGSAAGQVECRFTQNRILARPSALARNRAPRFLAGFQFRLSPGS